MSTFKKLLALTLALAMVLSVSAFAGYNPDTYKDATSIDEDCEEAIELLYALDIMKGDANGNFNPTATITRAEVAKMIYVILNYGKDDKAVTYTGAKMFSDVPAGAWFEGYVNYAAATKLVQGRGNGTFGPNDPVTCAEAAKMLLTAIGYSAEARGYTGANWSKNVLSDAAILGLLDGYKYNTNTYAPRQWVAVMFENALGCYTFNTMVPSFNGLLISGSDDYKGYDTMGGKYYGLFDKEVYAYATDSAYIDRVEIEKNKYSDYASDGYVLFSDGSEFKNTGLGAMDLGQKYRVIARDNKALSVRPIDSIVAEAPVCDIEYAYSYNKGDSTREFTIGDMTAAFDSAKIHAISNLPKDKGVYFGDFTEKLLMDKLDNLSKDMVKAIDKNGDGDIDYLIITYSDYAFVRKAGTDKSGDYVILQQKDAQGNYVDIKSSQSGKQWLGGEVESEDELEAGNYVKRTWNLDNRSYDLEVLPVVHDVKYTNKEGIKEPVYTIGDVEYQLATKGFTKVADMPSRNTKVSVVYDEDLAVYVGQYVFTYDDMEDIYAQLSVFVESFSMNSSVSPNRNVTGVAYYDMVPELNEIEFAGKKAQLGENDANKYHLFATETDEDGAYLTYLKGLEADIADVRAALSADEELIGAFKTGYGTLNGKKDSFAFERGRTYKFDEDARFFVITKSGSKVVVDVNTIADIEEKSYSNIYAELLYSPVDANGRMTIVGGLLDMRTRTYGTSKDVFFITEVDNRIETITDDDVVVGYGLDVRVQFSDNTPGDVTLTFETEDAARAAKDNIKLYALYGYTYDGDADTYTLGERKEKASFDFNDVQFEDPKGQTGVTEIVIDDLNNFGEVVLDNNYVLSCDEDTVIALTIKHYSNDNAHELMDVEHFFTDLAGWEEALGDYSIVNGKEVESGEVESFTCYSDVAYYDGKLLNICIYADDLWK